MKPDEYHVAKKIRAERQRRIDAAVARLVRDPLEYRMDFETLDALEGVVTDVKEGRI